MAEKLSAGAVIGIVLGGLMLIILVTIISPYLSELWGLLSDTEFSSQTEGSFERLVTTINGLEKGESKIIPMWVDEDANEGIMSFSSYQDKLPVGLECIDPGRPDIAITDKEIPKPCSKSCLCLCHLQEYQYQIDRCSSNDCVDFDYDFEGDCYYGHAFLKGSFNRKIGWYNVKVTRIANKIRIEGLDE